MLNLNLKLKRNKRLIFVSILTLLVWPIYLLASFYFMNVEGFQKNCILSALFLFVFELRCIYKLSGHLFNPTILFLLSFYFFQNGQFLLFVLGVDFNNFYINYLREHTFNAILFSSLSCVVAGLSGCVAVKRSLYVKRYKCAVDSYTPGSISKAALIGMCITGIIAMPLIFVKFFGYARVGGYYAVRAFEDSIPSFISVFEYLFVPFCVLFLVYSKSRSFKWFVYVTAFLWFFLTMLCGDRTTGISGIFVLFLIDYLSTKSKKAHRRSTLKMVLVCIFSIIFIRVAFLFRMQENVQNALETDSNMLVDVISELGFSSFPLYAMMDIVPAKEDFLYGFQYLCSFFAGFIPASLDVTGISEYLFGDWNIFNDWINLYYSQFDFGLGFSLNAEAYINFGWFGVIAIFILCYFVNKNLCSAYALMNKGSMYGIYKTLILLFLWFTLARRNSYYIWNAIFWCVFVMNVYLRLLCKKSQSRSKFIKQ